VRRRFSAAIGNAPSTPTPALSVGVAKPAKMAPSTTTIRKVIGNRPFRTTLQSSPQLCGP
jgi:hypothetical protein